MSDDGDYASPLFEVGPDCERLIALVERSISVYPIETFVDVGLLFANHQNFVHITSKEQVERLHECAVKVVNHLLDEENFEKIRVDPKKFYYVTQTLRLLVRSGSRLPRSITVLPPKGFLSLDTSGRELKAPAQKAIPDFVSQNQKRPDPLFLESLHRMNERWLVRSKIVDMLMRSALDSGHPDIVVELYRTGMLSAETIIEACPQTIEMAFSDSENEAHTKKCLLAYIEMTPAILCAEKRLNIHIDTCERILRSETHSVQLNTQLIDCLSEVFQPCSTSLRSKTPVSDIDAYALDLDLKSILSLPLCNHLISCLSQSYRKAALVCRQEHDDDEDDDSEPILGAWYEEVLNQSTPANPDKDHMLLATRLVEFLDTKLASNDDMKGYFCENLSKAHMITFANIIKDLDSRTLATTDNEFSATMQRFVHNLFVNETLGPEMQETLLSTLGINIWGEDEWPLEIPAKSLSILGLAILHNPAQEKLKIRLWQKVIASLSTQEFGHSSLAGHDLNVEHVQLLLYFFDSISLVPRKEILLTVVKKITDTQVRRDYLALARLLLILEYLVKHYYATPIWLPEQVSTNIFSLQESNARSYFHCEELEENFTIQEGSQRKIKFYALCKDVIPGQSPKLDGLAMNILLAPANDYTTLYDRILEILDFGSHCESASNYFELCSIQYCLTAAWRLFLSLHPSADALINKLESHPLLLCIFVPRLKHQKFQTAITEAFGKQTNDLALSKKLIDSVNELSVPQTLVQTHLTDLISKLEKGTWSTSELLSLEVVLARLETYEFKGESGYDATPMNASDTSLPIHLVSELLLKVLDLIRILRSTIHKLVLKEFDRKIDAYDTVLEISSSHAMDTNSASVTLSIAACLPESLTSILNRWNITLSDNMDSWKTAFAHQKIPSESLIVSVANLHIGSLSKTKTLSYSVPLKRALHFAVRFASQLFTTHRIQHTEFLQGFVPLVMDATTEHQSFPASVALQYFPGGYEVEMHSQVMKHCFKLLTLHVKDICEVELIFNECIKYIDTVIDKPYGRQALLRVSESYDLWSILYCACEMTNYANYAILILKVFNNFWRYEEIAHKLTETGSLLVNVTPVQLCKWFQNIMTREQVLEEFNGASTNLIEKFISSAVPVLRDVRFEQLLFDSLTLLAEQEGIPFFPKIMTSLTTLAFRGEPKWQIELPKRCAVWMQNEDRGRFATDFRPAIVKYQAKLIVAMKALAAIESEDIDDVSSSDASEAGDNDDSIESLSDDECLKLCTYTITQKEFMSQHWYHCYTCSMIDGVGVCSVCAKVCHKDHDVTYAKYGSFFCDCGAKSDGSCLAIDKRMAAVASTSQASGSDQRSMKKQSSDESFNIRATNSVSDRSSQEISEFALSLLPVKDELRKVLINSTVVGRIVQDISDVILPKIKQDDSYSPSGTPAKAEEALHVLHKDALTFETVNDLMLVTIGSQEGAFENVKMTIGNDQTLRTHLQNHNVRRVAMCAMSSGKRQHVAVSHETGKITLLQLNTLLKQADMPRKRLTITRLNSAPIAFTVLSLAANPSNDTHLAVCGLKDCHIMSFGTNGAVLNHLSLACGIEGQNYIIKSAWLPGSQVEVAIVTGEFIKIFDLSSSASAPVYHFILASGNVKDLTFAFIGEERHVIIMSTNGFIYHEKLNANSMSSREGFYVTNVMQVDHAGAVGGGTSVYYSHSMQMLFMSYANSKSFVAPLTEMNPTISPVSIIQLQTKNPSSMSNKLGNGQPLCAWSEIPNHPGIVLAMQQFSNNPVVIMIKPGTPLIQEIKLQTSKSKISDMVVLRHQSRSGEPKTDMVVLSEDGSLKVFTANLQETSFWINLQPSQLMPVKRASRRSKKRPTDTTSVVSAQPVFPGTPVFPVDFFEHCTEIHDVSFGGNDLLEVYNREQLRTRLSNNKMSVACTKSAGFRVEITNMDSNMVITGVRIGVGYSNPQRVPSFVEMFGRTKNIACEHSRTFDIPFTREESLQSDKKLVLYFGVSKDPNYVTILDSINVHGKPKEVFNWPEENEEVPSGSSSVSTQNPLEEHLRDSLQVIETGFSLAKLDDGLRRRALDCASQLLVLPISEPEIQNLIKSILTTLDESSKYCVVRRDKPLLRYVEETLSAGPDGEAFYRLTVIIKSIAVPRADAVKALTNPKFIDTLMTEFWRLLTQTSTNLLVAPISCRGLAYIETTVQNLVDILFAMMTSDRAKIVNHIVDLLLYPNTQISFTTKFALIRAIRPKWNKTASPSKTREKAATQQITESDEETQTSSVKLTDESMILVTELIKHLGRIDDGLSSIPYLQVLLFMVNRQEHVASLVTEAICLAGDVSVEFNSKSYVHYLFLKLCSCLVSKKAADSALILFVNGIIERCYTLLERLAVYWSTPRPKHDNTLLKKQRLDLANVDMSPFIDDDALSKTNATDIFEDYQQNLTEIALKLPCQVKKELGTGAAFDDKWQSLLCELTMNPHASFARKQTRKLLSLLCGTKEVYKRIGDMHAFDVHMSAVRKSTDSESSYDSLIGLMDHLKSCVDIATQRVTNWKLFCETNDWVLAFLMEASYSIYEGVAPAMLQLLQFAICEKEKAQELAKQLCTKVDEEVVLKFIVSFLLDSNTTSIRWQAHSFINHLHSNSGESQKGAIVRMMWSLWPKLPLYGRKASQFVDLLGYFSLSRPCDGREQEYCREVISMLKQQNTILANHPNAYIYNSIQGLVESDGYYLECDPCLVCNNPETPFALVKLSQIKVDSRFTTSSQIVKLLHSQVISKMTLRISDIKKRKTVKTVNIYYNNRAVQSVVDLRNNKGLWSRAKSCTLTQGQGELKVEFPLPIIACNLMIEFADFYENSLLVETLQCPRCSAAVPAVPGVCHNCGEQVYQCHKCRQINYDEKDPFLCNNCGFCRYAKFDFQLYSKQCCAVNPVEDEEERKKAVTYMQSQLEVVDKFYTIMQGYKPMLEGLLSRIHERGDEEEAAQAMTGNNAHVNRSIQQLAQKYGTDCKTTFDDLSATVQKILACRKELVAYVCKQRGMNPPAQSSVSSGKCFGCVCSSIVHCVTFLRAMSSIPAFARELCSQGLIEELVDHNMRQGTQKIRKDVRLLLVSLTTDNLQATQALNALILRKVKIAIDTNLTDLYSIIRHEMTLLALSVSASDSCWEERLRTVFMVFRMLEQNQSHAVIECVTLPCLRIILGVINVNGDRIPWKAWQSAGFDTALDIDKWIGKHSEHGFERWTSKERERSISEQCGFNWRRAVKTRGQKTWLERMMFNKSSRQARDVSCQLTETLSESPWCYSDILDMLTTYLEELNTAGENGARFMELYQILIQKEQWKKYVVIRGLMSRIVSMMETEIDSLNKLEDAAVSSDLTQGSSLKILTHILSSLLSVNAIRQKYKSTMLAPVLDGYLSLRRLVVQRTKLIDDSQEKLLALLEQMTTGTESETKAFLELCVETVKKFGKDDIRTPVFIFERMCNLIYPEDNGTKNFYVSIEKDSAQEEFLQGSMYYNPYSSADLGPLMRDVKNKICNDCALVAFLEDDNGMELLVCNRIISLDIPVKDVYKKLWCLENNPEDPMRVVFRMRGLLGDATESFVESLGTKNSTVIDEEEVYGMSAVLGECGGLEVIVDRLASLHVEKALPLLQVILKLLDLCIRIKSNRESLVKIRCIPAILNILKASLNAKQALIPEKIIGIIERIIQEALLQDRAGQENFFSHTGTDEDIRFFLDCAKNTPPLLSPLMRVVPSLTLMNESKMQILIDHFLPHLDFERLDNGRAPESETPIECFIALGQGLDTNPLHHEFRDWFVKKGLLKSAVDYLLNNAPTIEGPVPVVSDEWKQFVAKPAVKVILRLLAGFCRGHDESQLIIGTAIPVLHCLEQVSSKEHVGSLAEILLEVLREGNISVKNQVDDARRRTRAGKKKKAMETREKALDFLGLKTNEKGQYVRQSGAIYNQMDCLDEEKGLTCIICREGYLFQPQKVLAIYTFTKKCDLDEHEVTTSSRKTLGYSTVTHFNVIHVECHVNAVRSMRGREEWESALLQNNNTRCNGLLPLWGPQVPDVFFNNALTRHCNHIQEVFNQNDISHTLFVHDLKLLLIRFAFNKSFSEDANGGGPESNMHLVPYLLHLAVNSILSSSLVAREQTALAKFLDYKMPKLHQNFFEVEGPLYYVTLALAVWPPSLWKEHKIAFVRRLLQCAQARILSSNPDSYVSVPRTLAEYKPYLLMAALVDKLYKTMFVIQPQPTTEQWPKDLQTYIRANDIELLESAKSCCEWFLEFEKHFDSLQALGEAMEISFDDDFIQKSLPLT